MGIIIHMKKDLKIIQKRQESLRTVISMYCGGVNLNLAKAMDIDQNTVGRWLSEAYESKSNFRPIPDARCRQIEKIFNLPLYWMDNNSVQNIDSLSQNYNNETAVTEGGRVYEARESQNVKMLPKLNSTQSFHAASMLAGNDNLTLYPVGTSVCSKNSFFYTIEDDSMLRNGHAKSLPAGSDLIVDMDVKAVPGDVVLIAVAESEKAIPRIYKDLGGGEKSFIPLNDFFPTLSEAEIIGVVVSVNIPLRSRAL